MSSNGSPHSPDVDDICCLIDEGERCQNSAANVQWTKKFSKAVGQKRLRISPDLNVSKGALIGIPLMKMKSLIILH